MLEGGTNLLMQSFLLRCLLILYSCPEIMLIIYFRFYIISFGYFNASFPLLMCILTYIHKWYFSKTTMTIYSSVTRFEE